VQQRLNCFAQQDHNTRTRKAPWWRTPRLTLAIHGCPTPRFLRIDSFGCLPAALSHTHTSPSLTLSLLFPVDFWLSAGCFATQSRVPARGQFLFAFPAGKSSEACDVYSRLFLLFCWTRMCERGRQRGAPSHNAPAAARSAADCQRPPRSTVSGGRRAHAPTVARSRRRVLTAPLHHFGVYPDASDLAQRNTQRLYRFGQFQQYTRGRGRCLPLTPRSCPLTVFSG